MIDIHSHILPGIDDGARTLEDSLEMAQIAADDGIEQMVCTPHMFNGLFGKSGTPRPPGSRQSASGFDRLDASRPTRQRGAHFA